MASKTKKSKKKVKKQKRRKNSTIKNILFFISLIIIVFFIAFAYYRYVYISDNKKLLQSDEKSTQILMNKMRMMLENEKKRLKEHSQVEQKVKKELKQNRQIEHLKEEKLKIDQKRIVKEIKKIPKEHNNYLSEIKDYQKSLKFIKESKKEPKVRKKRVTNYDGKPKLAIIIDDVSFLSQVKLIKKIPYKVNPSFFPLTPRHPNTKELSKKFPFAMIHLPMEAINYARAEKDTLLVSDSKDTIKAKIDNIRRDFPNINYYNNHTGSKFTSDKRAMERFIDVVQQDGIIFIDSRTTSNTKAPIIYKQRGLKLLSRDVFLDNSTKPSDIITQLKKAVKIAKKHGYAIAICHPHTNTLRTLIKAKPYLTGVKMVYINEL